jgi:hypothetical protein
MNDGSKTILGGLIPESTGYATSTYSLNYQGPGRGAGNSINALLDGYILSNDKMYLEHAESFVHGCIHPQDDISKRHFEDIEARWSYLIFLQVMGRYLDLKYQWGEFDYSFHYARQSLLHYALWMDEYEVPYMQVLDKVEYPTETWPAQDLRKSCIFDYAAIYGEKSTFKNYRHKAKIFYHEGIQGVKSFSTSMFSRPQTILLTCGYPRDYFCRLNHPYPIPERKDPFDFGSPSPFIAQKQRFRKMLKSPGGLLKILGYVMRRPRLYLRLIQGKYW